MAVAYFDSSAFVKLLVTEDGSDLAAEVWDYADSVASNRLSFPEVTAALAAARRARRLTPSAEADARGFWDGYWSDTRVVELTTGVASEAAKLSARFILGGADSVHLASALVLAEADLILATWDRRLHDAAVDAGLTVLPE